MTNAPSNSADSKQQALQLYQQGDYHESLVLLEGLCIHEPFDREVHALLGAVYLQLSRYEQAENCFRKVLAQQPVHAQACYGLGLAVGAQGNALEATKYLNKSLEIQPDNPDVRVRLGALQQLLGEHHAALGQYRWALKQDPDHLEAHIRSGDLALNLGDLEKSEAAYRKALKLSPGEENAAAGLAAIQLRQARYEAAYRTIRPLLEQGTDNASIASLYADVCRHVQRCQDAIELLERLVADDRQAFDQRIKLLFALGKLHDRMANYDQAFRCYREGNDLMPVSYDPWSAERDLQTYIDFWNERFLAGAPRARKHNKRKRPVFIVGMPRSGTSLLEQILASHPSAHAAGELQDITDIVVSLPSRLGVTQTYPACLERLTQGAVDDIARAYQKKIEALSPKCATVVTDKMPDNFRHLGLIQLLFPKTRVIHCVRDPLDTCLSCYFQNFFGEHDYSYNLQNLGTYYRLYERLMRHWKQVLDLKILDVRYEDLVTATEATTRSVVNFCGLPWNDRCLSFQKTRRAVVTSSYDQASRPIYHESLRRWEHYRPYLEPVCKGLQVPVPGPADT